MYAVPVPIRYCDTMEWINTFREKCNDGRRVVYDENLCEYFANNLARDRAEQ